MSNQPSNNNSQATTTTKNDGIDQFFDSDTFTIDVKGLDTKDDSKQFQDILQRQQKEIEKLRQQNERTTKRALIEEIKSTGIDTSEFEKLYTTEQLEAIRGTLAKNSKVNILVKEDANDPQEELKRQNQFDMGWFDHTKSAEFPNGVWRSTIDDSILKSQRGGGV